MFTLTPTFKAISPPQEKSFGYSCDNMSLVSYFQQYRDYSMAARQSLIYYDACAPLYSGADWITNEVSIIEPKIWDKNKKKFLDTHPLLDLLEIPNFDSSYDKFIYALATYFIITGNGYLMVQFGGVKNIPQALYVVSSQTVDIDLDSMGIAKSYRVGSRNSLSTLQFNKIFENGNIRYLTKDGIFQLFHIKNFNACGNQAYGGTRLNSVYLEIEQYITAGIHNLTLLERGGNLSGIFTTDQVLGDEGFQRVLKKIQKQFSGAKNAGIFGMLDSGLKFDKISSSNKDMDFLALKKSVTNTIYNNLRIPLALVTPETMTMANMAAAKILLYDNATLPLTNRLFVELTKFLMPFYPNSENLVLAYDPRTISALQDRRNAELEMHAKLGVLTINELRELIGYDSIEDGDELLVPSADIPLGTSSQVQGNDKSSRETFMRIMQNMLVESGERAFTDDEITQFANTHGLS